MAFTSGNDLNILQEVDTGVVGAGLGDDIYVITASNITTAKKITLSDTDGTNILKIVGGVTITSSIFAAEVAQLVLSPSGATININNANTFTFEVGGDPFVSGSGTTLNFAGFAQALGVSTLPTGNTISNGTAGVTTNTDGTISGGSSGSTSTFALAASNTAVDEGSTATFTLTTTNIADGTSIPYTITGVDASDIIGGSLTGTATVTNNTATITTDLSADTTTESAETLTVTLDGKTTSASITVNDTSLTTVTPVTFALAASGKSVDEGGTATFSLTTTNVTDGTRVPYTITGVDPSDITGGLLIGSTTVSNNISNIAIVLAADKTTEGSETLTISLDGQSASASTTVNDTSVNDTVKETTTLDISTTGTTDASSGDIKFIFTQGSYEYNIIGFDIGDSLDVLDSASISVLNAIAEGDLDINVADATTGSVVQIHLTGIDTALDAKIFSVSTFNTIFGADTLA